MERMRRRASLAADAGSAVAEFVMVVFLLTVLTLSVMQLALALHIRNTVLDAAAEGARFAALADTGPDDGAERTRDLITAALGRSYATDVRAGFGRFAGQRTVEVRVAVPLPLIGLLGPGHGLEVVGHAALEGLD
ncbi:MAG TPA: TadE/TadG family type IV pilus assembly protein [Cryobacterium sp.]|nr:TadE/TadG family type IV pilus assembly protein [Cryobacterium sp.]